MPPPMIGCFWTLLAFPGRSIRENAATLTRQFSMVTRALGAAASGGEFSIRADAILEPLHRQTARLQIELFPAEANRLADPQAVPVHYEQ